MLQKTRIVCKIFGGTLLRILQHGSENGPTATVCKVKNQYPKLNENTVRKRYDYELAGAKRKRKARASSTTKKPQQRRSRLLGKLGSMAQKYIQTASNRWAINSRTIANSTVKALMSRYPELIVRVELDSFHWGQRLFRRMAFVWRRITTAKLEISKGFFKGEKMLFTHGIVSKYQIPDYLLINIDQKPKYAAVRQSALAKKYDKTVAITGRSDKRTIRATFALIFSRKFVPIQLIYVGKTSKSLPYSTFQSTFPSY